MSLEPEGRTIKQIWTSFLTSRYVTCWQETTFLKKFHGWATIVWFLISWPLALWLGDSVVFVTFLSLYAIVTGHWSSWQSTRVEEKQDILEVDNK